MRPSMKAVFPILVLFFFFTAASACGRGGGKTRSTPVVIIKTPTTAATYVTNTTPIALGGRALDNKGIASVTWSNAATGGSGAATGTTAWTSSVPLASGSNLITVTASDADGKTGTDSITVTLDQTVPTVTIDTPTTAPTYSTGSPQLSLGGTAWDDVGVTQVTWSNADTGGSGTATGTTSWTASVPLALGSNLITVTAADAAANVGTDSITVTKTSTGTLKAWGANLMGQLGDGTTTRRLTPVRVIDPSDPSGFLTGAIAIDAALNQTVALIGDGTVRTWGYNNRGQLGDGTTTTRLTPVQVIDPSDPSGVLTGVVAIMTGTPQSHTGALLGNGTVRTWGGNSRGQLGDGTTTGRLTPVGVVDGAGGFLTGVRAVAAGSHSTRAVLVDGTVWAWGTGGSPTPAPVSDASDPSGFLAGVTAAGAGSGHTLALQGNPCSVFSDDFTGSENVAWDNASGSWFVTANDAYAAGIPDNNPPASSFVSTLDLTDFTFEVDVNGARDGGVFLRASDLDNGVVFVLRPATNEMYWHVRQSGNWGPFRATVSISPYTAGDDIHVSIVVSGTEYKATITGAKGTFETTLNEGTFSSGKPGLYDFVLGQEFDNVCIR